MELISLDGCSLTTAGLHSVVSALQNGECSASLMTMNLSNNMLTAEACTLLHSALQNPSFCPSLLTLNLQDNPKLDEGGQGISILEQMISLRPELQVICFLHHDHCPGLLAPPHHCAQPGLQTAIILVVTEGGQ